jgi:hypothetical protein
MDRGKQRERRIIPINTLLMLFFSDVAYAILPIITIAILRLALNQPFEHFLLLPEWSFASIVFFGLCIKNILELKVKYQRDFSDKLFLGPQFFALPLIASVLTLALVELNEINKSMNERFLIGLQLVWFISGIGCLLIVNYAIGVIREQASMYTEHNHDLEARLTNLENAIRQVKADNADKRLS